MVRNFVYGDASMKLTTYLPKWQLTVIPILMHFFIIFPLKMYYFALKASAASMVESDVSQWKMMLHNDIVFQ